LGTIQRPTAYQAVALPLSYAAINIGMITADDAMQYLYQEAQGDYQQRFYSTTTRKFTLDRMLINPAKEFKLDTTFVVPPPGSDPGSPDFQSGAMTTSAKEA
jgi:hypothetical protein